MAPVIRAWIRRDGAIIITSEKKKKTVVQAQKNTDIKKGTTKETEKRLLANNGGFFLNSCAFLFFRSSFQCFGILDAANSMLICGVRSTRVLVRAGACVRNAIHA